jgi:hypothetical protein
VLGEARRISWEGFRLLESRMFQSPLWFRRVLVRAQKGNARNDSLAEVAPSGSPPHAYEPDAGRFGADVRSAVP